MDRDGRQGWSRRSEAAWVRIFNSEGAELAAGKPPPRDDGVIPRKPQTPEA